MAGDGEAAAVVQGGGSFGGLDDEPIEIAAESGGVSGFEAGFGQDAAGFGEDGGGTGDIAAFGAGEGLLGRRTEIEGGDTEAVEVE
jgi:hypothetical protein